MDEPEVFDELPPKGGMTPHQEHLSELMEKARTDPGMWVVVWEDRSATMAAKKAQSLRDVKKGKEQGEQWKFSARTLYSTDDSGVEHKRHVVLALVEYRVEGGSDAEAR